MLKTNPPYLLTTLILLTILFQNSQAQTWEWVNTENGSGNNDFVWDMVKDSKGDFYGGGRVSNNPTFGNVVVTNHGTTDFWLQNLIRLEI